MTVLITGANRGIGRALFDRYAAAGEDVWGTTRTGAASAGWIALDVTAPDMQGRLRAALGDRPLDLLVCNAGVYPDKGEQLAHGYPAEMWADAFAANVTGAFQTVQALLPNLRAADGAKIALISSQMASHTRAPGGSYIYRATKAALLNLGRNLATDLKSQDIAVGIYHPGWVQTDMGGPAAEITVDQAADGLVARFADLTIDTTGCFQTWDGRPHAF